MIAPSRLGKKCLLPPPYYLSVSKIMGNYLRFFFLCANISRFIANRFFVFFECDFLFLPISDPRFTFSPISINKIISCLFWLDLTIA